MSRDFAGRSRAKKTKKRVKQIGGFLLLAVVLFVLLLITLQLIQPLFAQLLAGGKTCFLSLLLGFNPGVFFLLLGFKLAFTLLLIQTCRLELTLFAFLLFLLVLFDLINSRKQMFFLNQKVFIGLVKFFFLQSVEVANAEGVYCIVAAVILRPVLDSDRVDRYFDLL